MKSAVFTFLFLLIIIISSCQKEYTGPRTLTAQAIDKTTNKPVPDTWLYLLRKEKGEPFNFNPNSKEIMEVKKSDAEGKGEFTFDYQVDYVYYFYAINENGYLDNGNNDATISYKQKKGEIEILLQPSGYLKFHFKDQQPLNPEKSVTVSLLSISPIKGNNIDTIICCYETNGNATKLVTWWVYEDLYYNGDKFQQTVYVPAHDTTLITIEY